MNAHTALPVPAGPPMVLAWLGLALGVALLIPGWQAVRPVQATVTHAAPVVVHADRHGQYHLDGQVNGIPVHLLVDTGAAEVVVPERLARAAGLAQGKAVRYRSVGGPVVGLRSRIRELRLGDLALRDVPATIVPGGGPVLLGMSALRHLNLVQRDGRLVLYAE